MGIIKISKRIEYALMSLKHLHQSEDRELISAREICDKYRIPFDTTAKVMQSLNNAQLLNSEKGIKGGYWLSIDLSNVSFLELCEIVEGKQNKDFCSSGKGTCELFNNCNIKTPIDRLNKNLLEFFNSITVKELLGNNFEGLYESQRSL